MLALVLVVGRAAAAATAADAAAICGPSLGRAAISRTRKRFMACMAIVDDCRVWDREALTANNASRPSTWHNARFRFVGASDDCQ